MFRLLLIASLFSLSARAEDPGSQNTHAGPSQSVGSEYLHQTTGGHFELTPALGIYASTIRYKNSSDKTQQSFLPITVKGEYGFSDLFSLSAKLGVGLGVVNNTCPNSTCDDTVLRGAMDPVLSANFRIPTGIMALRFGADLSTSLGNHKIESNGDTNVASGGTSLTPNFGMDFSLPNMVMGFQLKYDLYRGDRTNERPGRTPSETKDKKANRLGLAAFYEYNFPRIVSIGSALEYLNQAASETESTGVTTKNKDALDHFNLNVYVPLRFTPRVTLVPAVWLGATQRDSSSTVKDQTDFSMNVLARFTF